MKPGTQVLRNPTLPRLVCQVSGPEHLISDQRGLGLLLVCVCVCVHKFVFVNLYACMCTSVSMCVYICVHVCACMCVEAEAAPLSFLGVALTHLEC